MEMVMERGGHGVKTSRPAPLPDLTRAAVGPPRRARVGALSRLLSLSFYLHHYLQCPTNTTTAAGATGAASADACFLSCDPGFFALVAQGPDAQCFPCRAGFYCPGGPQTSSLEGTGENGARLVRAAGARRTLLSLHLPSHHRPHLLPARLYHGRRRLHK